LYLQTLYLLTIHADTAFGYSYQFAGTERCMCVCKFWKRENLKFAVGMYSNSLFAACDCPEICYSLPILCISVFA